LSQNIVAQTTSFDHPTDEMLERLLLHRSQNSEREVLESHMLACPSCLVRVEDLQDQITATKLALQKIKTKRAARAASSAQLARLKQLAPPILLSSLALAVLTVGLFLIPHGVQENGSIAKVSLSVYRDSEHAVLPQGRPAHVTIDAADVPDGPVLIEIVNPLGAEIWRGHATVFREKAEILAPPITHIGVYLLRLYPPGTRQEKSEILTEFVFHVK
jgi:hypothetical protein